MEITEEMQAAIDAAVEAATSKLKAKNSELVKEVRTLGAAKTTAEEQAQQAAEDAATKAGDIEALRMQLEAKHKTALDAMQAKYNAANTQLETLLINDVIKGELNARKLPAHQIAALTLQLKTGAKVENGVAVHGDMQLGDYLKSYFTTDEGKAWLPAAQNVGTGSAGVTNANAMSMKRPETQDELLAYFSLRESNRPLADSLADTWGMSELKGI